MLISRRTLTAGGIRRAKPLDELAKRKPLGLRIENDQIERLRSGERDRLLGDRDALDLELAAIENRGDGLERAAPDPRKQDRRHLFGHDDSPFQPIIFPYTAPDDAPL